MRLATLLLPFLFASVAHAQLRASFGLRAAYEEDILLAGPALEATFLSWSGEMFIESGSGGRYKRERFHVELRRPVNDWLNLVGGTHIDRLETEDFTFDGESLFAGIRVKSEWHFAEIYSTAHLLRGMTENRNGYGLEAGVLLRLPQRMTLPLHSRRGRFEVILSGEHEDLGDDRLDRRSRAAIRFRYAIIR